MLLCLTLPFLLQLIRLFHFVIIFHCLIFISDVVLLLYNMGVPIYKLLASWGLPVALINIH